MTLGMLATARALAALPGCPALAQFVVSEAEHEKQCAHCREPWPAQPTSYCPACAKRPARTFETKAADTVPDLTNAGNGGRLLAALWLADPSVRAELVQETGQVRVWHREWTVCERGATLAEAAALALLAVS